MKVLQLGKFYPIRGGVEKVMWNLTKGLGEQGQEVDMLCASLSRDANTIQLGPSARVICVPALIKLAATMISPAMIFRLRTMIRDAARKGKPYDIIHIHHPDPMAAVALFFSGWKGKVVLHWHSDILKQKTLLFFFKPLQNWLLRRADRIVGTTPVYVAESPFLQDYKEKLTCLPIGIDPLPSGGAAAQAIRERFEGKKIVWSLGRLVGYKGFEYLIGAIKYLPEDYVLIIGGEGPLHGELEKLSLKYGVSDRVHLIGRKCDEECAAWFDACDVFVMSSIKRTEAFGIVQIEAMSLGKPVVSTRIPGSGVSWVNQDGESGLTVPVCDSRSIAEAVQKVCLSNAEYGAGAHKRYEKLFTFDKMISGCIQIYGDL